MLARPDDVAITDRLAIADRLRSILPAVGAGASREFESVAALVHPRCCARRVEQLDRYPFGG